MKNLTAFELVQTASGVLHAQTMLAIRKIHKARNGYGLEMPSEIENNKPDRLSASLTAELAFAARLLAHAMCDGYVCTEIDAVRYCDRLKAVHDHPEGDDKILLRYGGSNGRKNEAASLPCTFSDKFGKIILWYLPGILLPSRQRKIVDALDGVPRQLQENEQKSSETPRSWPTQEGLFRQSPEGSPGTPTFAPAWYYSPNPIGDVPPRPSTTLTGRNWNSGQRFLDNMAETNALIAAIISVIHPEQYQLGMACRSRAGEEEGLQEVISHWASCFTGLAVVRNRVCPEHFDNGSPYGSYDVVATLGRYSGGRFNLPNGPIDLAQTPGTITACSTRMVRREVDDAKGRHLYCSWFVEEDVFSWAEIPQIDWSTIRDVLHGLHIVD